MASLHCIDFISLNIMLFDKSISSHRLKLPTSMGYTRCLGVVVVQERHADLFPLMRGSLRGSNSRQIMEESWLKWYCRQSGSGGCCWGIQWWQMGSVGVRGITLTAEAPSPYVDNIVLDIENSGGPPLYTTSKWGDVGIHENISGFVNTQTPMY